MGDGSCRLSHPPSTRPRSRPDDPGSPTSAGSWRSAYVHVPFCRRRCPYCDFAVVADGRVRPNRPDPVGRYVDAVIAEMSMEHRGDRWTRSTWRRHTDGASPPRRRAGSSTPSPVASGSHPEPRSASRPILRTGTSRSGATWSPAVSPGSRWGSSPSIRRSSPPWAAATRRSRRRRRSTGPVGPASLGVARPAVRASAEEPGELGRHRRRRNRCSNRITCPGTRRRWSAAPSCPGW